MITKNLIAISLFILGASIHQLTGVNETSEELPKDTIFFRLHTLSIHIKDPLIHDSVFHFLKNKLQLPVYYNPVTLGTRNYAGIFAGNMVLEPCGPYSNFSYATKDFKAIFFGLTFEPANSMSNTSKSLQEKKIKHEVASDEFIYLKDADLCGGNTAISIMDKHGKEADHAKFDSLRLVMESGRNSDLGIEYVKEIQIGYTNASSLKRWEELISPAKFSSGKVWKADNKLNIRFLSGEMKEVKGITFKVKSLEKAKKYLSKANISFIQNEKSILLDKSGTFGLTIIMEE